MSHKIGAHVSAAGGVELALERAAKIGCNCVQVFSGSPRVWFKPKLESVKAELISSNSDKYHVSPIFTHALYLVNLGSDKPELVQKSYNSLDYELKFDAHINGAGVIVHLGSHQGRGFDSVKDQVAAELVKLLQTTPDNSRLLIENAASRNGKIGGDLAEIAFLIQTVDAQLGAMAKKRLGWCYDTCHGFAAGYQLPQVLSVMDQLGLIDWLGCIHVNDSRDPFSSNRDRHANLGTGYLNPEELKSILNSPILAKIPFILEVPGFAGEGPDAENVEILREMLE